MRYLLLHNPGKLLRMIFRAQAPKQPKGRTRRAAGNESAGGSAATPKRRERIIPPEYGEDVEFTEYHSYTQKTVVSTDGEGNTRVRTETQITDAEWEEIKR